MKYSMKYIAESIDVLASISPSDIERMIDEISTVKNNGGRLFCIGVGGGASTASHAVNDFRKIDGIEAYSPVDNVAELTANINDYGWDYSFRNWLIESKLCSKDCVFVFSVGGGNSFLKISENIVTALVYAQDIEAKIVGIVGRDGGYTAEVADACIIIPTVHDRRITPHTESMQALLLHLIVNHPRICGVVDE